MALVCCIDPEFEIFDGFYMNDNTQIYPWGRYSIDFEALKDLTQCYKLHIKDLVEADKGDYFCRDISGKSVKYRISPISKLKSNVLTAVYR